MSGPTNVPKGKKIKANKHLFGGIGRPRKPGSSGRWYYEPAPEIPPPAGVSHYSAPPGARMLIHRIKHRGPTAEQVERWNRYNPSEARPAKA